MLEAALPISLSRKSQGGADGAQRKIAVTVNPKGTPSQVYYAVAEGTDLGKVLDTLALREGAPNTKDMAYIRNKSVHMEAPVTHKVNRQQKQITSVVERRFGEDLTRSGWAGKVLQLKDHQYKGNYEQHLIDWAKRNGFTAVVWTSLPSNIANPSRQTLRELLGSDSTLKANTRAYLQSFPQDLQTPQIKEIIDTGTVSDRLGTLTPEQRDAKIKYHT